MIIYKITNNVNAKSYIGQTKFSLGHRQKQHFRSLKNGSRLYIHNALRKWGKDSFSWEVLEYCKTADELNEKEKHHIELCQSYWTKNGYNLTYGGDGNGGLYGRTNGMYGKKHSDETLIKISNSRKGQHTGNKNPAAIYAGRYLITHPDGKKEEIINLRKWCRERGLGHSLLYAICNGKKTTPYKGYWCERLEFSLQKKRARSS